MEINEYLKAIKEGDVKVLEELAIAAGYTEEFLEWKEFDEGRKELIVKFHYATELLQAFDLFGLLSMADSFCDKYLPKIMQMRTDRKYTNAREIFGIPSNEEFESLDFKKRIDWLEKYSEIVQRVTGNIWANKEAGFIRTKPGPEPWKNSMVAYVTWQSFDKDYNVVIKPENRRFFIEVFDEDPLFEMKLDYGIYTSIHNERADMSEKGQKVEPYVYGEESGSGPHVVAFEPFEKLADSLEEVAEEDGELKKKLKKIRSFPRTYADGLRIAWGTENLVYGEDAVKYLIGLSNGNPNGLFPLSREGYQELIEHQREEVEEKEERLGEYKDYTPEQMEELRQEIRAELEPYLPEVEKMQEEARRLSEDVKAGKISEEDIPQEERDKMEKVKAKMDELMPKMRIFESYGSLQRERNELETLEEKAGRL